MSFTAAFDYPLITDADDAQTVTLTLTFSEPMNMLVPPTVSLEGGAADTLTNPVTSGMGLLGWTSSTTYVVQYTVDAARDQEVDNVTVTVSDAQNAAMLPVATESQASTTDVDTTADVDDDLAVAFTNGGSDMVYNESEVVTVSISGLDDDATGTLTITSDGVDSTDVVITGIVANGNVTLTPAQKAMLADGALTASFTVTDTKNAPKTVSANSYALDTDKPTVTAVTITGEDGPDGVISDADDGNTVTLEITFSELMDTSAPVTVALNTLDLTESGRTWNGNTLEVSYTVADNNADLTDITADVSGAQDIYGNTMDAVTGASTATSIDTLNPVSGAGSTSIDENPDGLPESPGSTSGTTLATFDAEDGVTYALAEEGNPGGAFAIVGNTLQIANATYLDREGNGPALDVELIATDDAGNTTAFTYTVNLNDVNDAPVVDAGQPGLAKTLAERADGAADENSPTGFGTNGVFTFTDDDATDSHTVGVLSTVRDGEGEIIGDPLGFLSAGLSGTKQISWTFGGLNAGDMALVDALALGESIVQVFTITINDGDTVTNQNITVTITGTNDDPVITVADAEPVSETVTGAQATGTISFTDVDLSDEPTVSTAFTSATYTAADDETVLTLPEGKEAALAALLTLDPVSGTPGTNNGSVGWSYSVDAATVDFLAEGETVVLTYTAAVDDGNGGTDEQTFTVTITGTNDAPVITGASSASVSETEMGAEASGTITFTDVDLSDRPEVTTEFTSAIYSAGTLEPEQQTALAAALTLTPDTENANDGSVGWAYSVGDAAVDFLAEGETVVLTYTAAVDDGNGGTDEQTFTVTITGTNDAPVITGASSASVSETEMGAEASGTITFTDVDLSDRPEVTTEFTSATYSAGTLEAEQQTALAAALTLTPDTENANDGSVGWAYSVGDAAVDFLAEGETVVLTYTAAVDDGNGGTDEQTFTVTITGTNDAPVITGASSASVSETEMGAEASGTITFTDVDLSDRPEVTTEFTSAIYSAGTLEPEQQTALAAALTLTPDTENANDGSVGWAYSVGDAAVDFLAEGETVVLTYTAAVDDGNGGTDEQTFTVTITGTNDAPVITGASSASVSETEMGAEASGTITFTDVDLSDRPEVTTEFTSAIYSAGTLEPEQQTALAAALTLTPDTENANDGSVGWAYSVGDAAVDFLAAGETVVLTYTATVDDGEGGTATQDFTVTITGTNDAPVITVTNPVADTEGDSLVFGETGTSAAPEDVVSIDLSSDTVDGSPEGTPIIDIVDVDQSDTQSVTITGVTDTTAGSVLTAINATSAEIEELFTTDGSTVSYDRNAILFDRLQSGQSITVGVAVSITSGPDTETRTVTLTIDGANDAPYFTNPGAEFDGDITEGVDAVGGVYSAQLSISYDDVELGDTHNASIQAISDGETPALGDYIGTFAVGFPSNATGTNVGEVLFNFTLDEALIENLSADQTIVQKYNVSVIDNSGASVVRPITITIQGSNDGPVITAVNDDDGRSIIEDSYLVVSDAVTTQLLTGTVEFDDIDTNSLAAADGAADTHSITASLTSATLGMEDASGRLAAAYTGATALTFDVTAANVAQTVANSAGWTFTITDGDFDFLADGDELELTYTITVTDEAGATATQDVTFTITGTNDAPVLEDITAATLTDTAVADTFDGIGGTLVGSDVDDNATLSYSASDADEDTSLSGFDQSVSNAFGTLYLNSTSGAYRFVADAAAVNALTESQDITFDLSVTDEHLASDTKTLTITLAGANDAPVLGAIVNGTVTDTPDDDTYVDVTGTFTSTDIDTGSTPTYSVVGQVEDSSEADYTHSVSNALGTLYLNEGTGAYLFRADDTAVEALSENTSADFAVTVTDDGGLTNGGTLTIDFVGANDNPRGTADAELANGTEDTAYTISEASLLQGFTDAEGDPLSVTNISADNGATVVSDGEGSFIVTPADDFNGTVTLTYDVVDDTTGILASQTQTVFFEATADPDTIVGNSTLDDSVLAGGNLLIDSGISGDNFAVARDDVDAPDLEIGLNAALRQTDERYIDTNIDPDGQTYVVPNGAAGGTAQDDGTTGNADDAFARWNVQISIGANIDDTDGSNGVIGDFDYTFQIEDRTGSEPTIIADFTLADLVDGMNGETPGSGDALLASSYFQVSWNFVMEMLGLEGFDPAEPGLYRVSVTANDKVAGTEVLANHIDIKVNEAPVAADDTLAATEDTVRTITAAELLGNDTDGNGDTLVIQSVTSAMGGTAELSEDGLTVTFTPDADFNGAASFTYIASDGQMVNSASNTGTVTVNVAAVNDAPVNTIGALTTDEDTDLTLTGLSIEDVDAASGLVSVTLEVGEGDGTIAAVATTEVTVAGSGTNAITLEGTVANINAYLAGTGAPVFSPALNLNGDVTLTMTTNDNGNTGDGGPLTDSDSVTITVTPVNDVPVAVDYTASVSEDDILFGTITGSPTEESDIPLSLFATDVDGDIDPASLSFTGATINGTSYTAAEVGLSYNPTTGALSFDASLALYQSLDQGDTLDVVVGFTVTDSGSLSDSGTATFTVTGTNDTPVLNDVTIGTLDDTPADDAFGDTPDIDGSASTTITGAVSDADADATFTYAIQGETPTMGATALAGAFGTLTLNTDGTYSYEADATAVNAATPQEGAANLTDTFTIVVTDEFGASDTATVTVEIAPANDTPELDTPMAGSITDDGFTTDFADVTGTLSATDRDDAEAPEGQLSYGLFDGTDTVASQTFYYDRANTTVTTTNGAGFIALGTLSVTATGDYTFSPDDAGIIALRSTETLSVNATVIATDGGGLSDTAPLVITIQGANNAPVAIDDSLTIFEGAFSNAVNVLTRGTADSDPDGDTITVSALADLDDTGTMDPLDSAAVGAAAGSITTDWGAEVSLQSNGQLTYNLTSVSAKFNELRAGQVATDTFSYTITDPSGRTDTATVSVTITGVNDAIAAVADTISVREDAAPELTGNLLTNDTDVDVGDSRQIISVGSSTTATAVISGTGFVITTLDGVVITLNTDGSYSLTAPQNLAGDVAYNALFQYTVQDGGGAQSTATVNVNVTGDNDAPEAVAVTLTASDEDQTRVITEEELLVGASDVDMGTTLTITDLSLTSGNGTLMPNGDGTWTYTPAENDDTDVTFSYTASDGTLTATSTATLDLLPVNDAAVISGDVSGTAAEDSATDVTGTLLAADVDNTDNAFQAASDVAAYG
ncbi:hypothetical protein P279_29100, partial [Rhodobacteraceae bacterium PD-2]